MTEADLAAARQERDDWKLAANGAYAQRDEAEARVARLEQALTHIARGTYRGFAADIAREALGPER